MGKQPKKVELRLRRKKRIRKKIFGTGERPRLSIFRSTRHIYAQVIDDLNGKTLVSVSSFEKGARGSANAKGCVELGKKLSERCKEKNIATLVFDKNGFNFHGRVKAFADAVREGGVKF